MSQSTYRNRRGNRVSIGEAIKDISEENAPTNSTKQPVEKPKAPRTTKTKKSKKNRQFRFPRLGRRYILIIALLFVVIPVFGLITVDAAKRDYDRFASTMQRQVSNLSKSPASTDTSATEATKQLSQSLDASSDCEPDSLGAANWYAPAKEAHAKCLRVAKDYSDLKSNLGLVAKEVNYVEKVGQILRDPLKSPNGDEFASLGEYESRWNEAAEQLAELSVPESLSEAHQDLSSRVEAIDNGWKALNRANSDQDQAAFSSAEKELTESYQTLRGSQQNLVKPINQRQQSINQLVNRLTIDT